MNILEKPRFIPKMPDTSPSVNSVSNIEDIQSSLKASLNIGGRDHSRSDLDEDVAAASKRILLHNIDFHQASAPHSIQRDHLRAKYISLNAVTAVPSGSNSQSLTQPQQGVDRSKTNSSQTDKDGESLPVPQKVLYPEEKIKMEWSRVTRIGAGLVNMGNTCFFNSTLQCLTYTAPLVNYCFTNDHREKCKKKDFCMMCEVQAQIKTSLDCSGRAIKPHSMLQKLRCIAKHMKWGRQEDAHEFLRFFVDRLQQSCLNGETKLDRFSKETTVINQIFGGYLRSQVTCLRCQGKSNTFDPFMDVSLDIKGVNSVEDALQKYVKPETLENDNAYKCPKCKNKVRAQKRFSIQKPPNVLTLQLNRFNFNGHFSGKINRFIRYPEKINLRNYMSQRQGEPVLYHLYGVLVHSGHSSDHGHYYSYVKSPSKTWYCMNDSSVHQVNTHAVFGADAYVLFYACINKNSSTRSVPNNTPVKNVSQVKTPYSSPLIPNHVKQDKSPMMNGIHGKPTSEMGTPIKRQESTGSLSSPFVTNNGPKIVPHSTPSSALPGSHSKISFPILTPKQKIQQQQQKDDENHIVLNIKHGNSTTFEKSPDGKSKVVNERRAQSSVTPSKNSALVPYNSDSDSEQESSRKASNSAENPKPINQRTSSFSDKSDHNISVRSIPLPSNCGDGPSQNDKIQHKGPSSSVSKISQSSSPVPLSKDSSQTLHRKPHNGSIQSPRSSESNQNDSSSHSPRASQQTTVSKSIDAQTSPKPSSSWSQAKAAGKGGIASLELPPVVHVSSSSSSTPVCSGKVKTTTSGNWYVQPQDCAPSPRGSVSSTNSVNSTTEWTVESKATSNGHVQKLAKTEIENGFIRKPSLTNSTIKSYESSKPVENGISNSLNHEREIEQKDSFKKSLFKEGTPPHRKEKKSSSENDISRTPVDIPDTQNLLFSPSSSSDCGLIRKVKKLKKKQKNRELKEDSSSRSDSASQKKKKHKDKKFKTEKNKKKFRKDSDSSDSDSSYRRHKYKKQKKSKRSSSSDSSDDSRHHKGSKRYSSDEEPEQVWVEKTKESLSQSPNLFQKSKASVQAWNHYIKDDLAPKKNGTTSKLTTQWDGARVPKITKDLGGSSLSLGNVMSWDGKKNHIDEELEEEKRNKKRQWSDDYNEELDAGKVKKIKKGKDDYGYNSNNPFQDHQSRNQGDKRPWSQDHSYHSQRHDDRKSSQSSFHFNKQKDHYSYSKNNSHFKPYHAHKYSSRT